jgi:glyoxylase-like metal-dependent hydrolase (beta-lactamase superfamily II)
VTYRRGLEEVGDGVFAYLQPDGGWGWSNAGLIVSRAGDALLVDTLFDLKLTEQMLGDMEHVLAGRSIGIVVNTHANGDHCYGNQLLPGARIIASEASAREMELLPPAALATLMSSDFGETTNQYLREAFGSFDFTGIEPPRVTETFNSTLSLTVGGRRVELIEVGPAHTAGDVLVHLPDDGVVFTGDILFIRGTPIVWDGPISNWIEACDRIKAMGCSTIVPGHGPLTDDAGVRAVADYLGFVRSEAKARFDAGMRADEAARDIELGHYREWLDWERIAINVDSVYRELDPGRPATGIIDLFRQMAELKQHK